METTTYTPELPDYFPTIIVDTAIGKDVERFNVNIHQLVETLGDSNMSPQQIAETTIIFDANRDVSHGHEAIGRLASNGTDVIVNPADYFEQSRKYHRIAYNPDDPDLFSEFYPSSKISKLLRHELEHRVVVTEGGMPEEERHRKVTHRKLIASSLLPPFIGAPLSVLAKETYLPSQSVAEYAGTLVVSGLIALGGGFWGSRKIINTSYQKSPEENRARSTETPDCRGLVTVLLKMPAPLQPKTAEQ